MGYLEGGKKIGKFSGAGATNLEGVKRKAQVIGEPSLSPGRGRGQSG